MDVPPPLCEVSDPPTGHDDPFGEQQRTLGKQIAPVASQFAASRDDAMAGDGGVARSPHDVADGAMGPRPASGRRYVAIGGDAPVRNTADDMADSRSKIRCFAPLADS